MASVTFTDQQIRNGTLVVEQGRLPQGGFLVAHNQSYQRTGDPMMSAVGLSGYMPLGDHSSVTLDVLPSTLNRSQTVTVRPARDTDNISATTTCARTASRTSATRRGPGQAQLLRPRK